MVEPRELPLLRDGHGIGFVDAGIEQSGEA
jgi:hypothetical protein